MAGRRLSVLKLISSVTPYSISQSSQACYPSGRLARFISNYSSNSCCISNGAAPKLLLESYFGISCFYGNRKAVLPLSASSKLSTLSSLSFLSSNKAVYRSYSYFSGKNDKDNDMDTPSASSENPQDVSDGDMIGRDWNHVIREAWQYTVDTAAYTWHKANEVADELIPHLQGGLNAHPYIKDVVVPVGWTLSATLLAWMVMPSLLRRLHSYATRGPTALISRGLFGDQVPYEKSFWGALEDPVRYLITIMSFSQIGVMVAPTTLASQYIAQAWRGAFILSLVWFLHRWKTNLFNISLDARNIVVSDRERLLTLDKLSSVGLFVLGLMALAEACGVAVQSFLTVGGIGGVATAFAARDILGNVLSGLSIQFSKPFSVGDTIKAGSIEGQVVEMGLTTTSLLSTEKFPVIVPNSLFSSQVIVNKSRGDWRAMIARIPLQIDGLMKVPQISDDIKGMLRSNPRVFIGKEAPYCFLSRVESPFAEITLGCNLKHMSKDEWYATHQDILLQSARIINEHGASVAASSMQGTSSP